MPRTHIHAITGGLVANKTAANEDNLGAGPTEGIRFGLKVGYPKQALIGSKKGQRPVSQVVFAAQKLRMYPKLGNPTVIIVVDRIDLDTQITATFNATDIPI